MREYNWSKGRWLSDRHLWALLLDIPKLPREDTGERVMLTPPPWLSREGFKEMPPVACKVFFVPRANIYIAIGEKANGYLDVLFFDKISYSAEAHTRIPNGKQTDYENW